MQVPDAEGLPARTTTREVCTCRDTTCAVLQQQRDCVLSATGRLAISSAVIRSAAGPLKMIGDTRFELPPDGDIEGSVHANSYMGGQRVVMNMAYAGERTDSGDCAASRQKRRAGGRRCSAGAAELRPGVDAAVPVNFGSFATARVAGAFLTGMAATRSGWRQDVTFASRRSGIGGA